MSPVIIAILVILGVILLYLISSLIIFAYFTFKTVWKRGEDPHNPCYLRYENYRDFLDRTEYQSSFTYNRAKINGYIYKKKNLVNPKGFATFAVAKILKPRSHGKFTHSEKGDRLSSGRGRIRLRYGNLFPALEGERDLRRDAGGRFGSQRPVRKGDEPCRAAQSVVGPQALCRPSCGDERFVRGSFREVEQDQRGEVTTTTLSGPALCRVLIKKGCDPEGRNLFYAASRFSRDPDNSLRDGVPARCGERFRGRRSVSDSRNSATAPASGCSTGACAHGG